MSCSMRTGERNLNLDNSYHRKTDQRHLSRLMITCQRDLMCENWPHVKTDIEDLSPHKKTNNRGIIHILKAVQKDQ